MYVRLCAVRVYTMCMCLSATLEKPAGTAPEQYSNSLGTYFQDIRSYHHFQSAQQPTWSIMLLFRDRLRAGP